jgi:hypothetical protein
MKKIILSIKEATQEVIATSFRRLINAESSLITYAVLPSWVMLLAIYQSGKVVPKYDGVAVDTILWTLYTYMVYGAIKIAIVAVDRYSYYTTVEHEGRKAKERGQQLEGHLARSFQKLG